MKLLKLEIGDLPKEKQFRSLQSGFKIEFHNLDVKGLKAIESFSPFCFAGLNGSGKSNVLEALGAIFFHLESCVSKFKPKAFEKHFHPEQSILDAYTLEYLIGQPESNSYTIENFYKITIIKEQGKAPTMLRQLFPFTNDKDVFKVSLEPRIDTIPKQAAEAKYYLPDIVVGYSSGENEILSLPFRKSRLINFDKYREDLLENHIYEEPENSLIYIDSEMSQAVLMACLLFEDEETIKPLNDELGIIGLRSFRMNIYGKFIDDINRKKDIEILEHIDKNIDKLKKCATTWSFHESVEEDKNGLKVSNNLILDFYIDKNTKRIFKEYFDNSFDLFRFFQVLYELNLVTVSEEIKEEVYRSVGFYTDWKIPKSSPREGVFVFEDYYILKEIVGETEPKELLLREFSDGEHQFLHTMGICLMLKNRRSLLLLDEPETHFNPSWRAKFIKILNDSIKAGSPTNDTNIHLLKDIILTSHSPFIISDCMPDNVIFFKKNENTKLLEAKNATDLGLNTYGSSVDYILKNFYKTNLISNKSYDELKDVIKNGSIDELRNAVEYFGESSEKQFLFRKIYEKMEKKDDN